MEHIKTIERRKGVDVGYYEANIVPVDREGCVGQAGIDKSYTFEKVLQLAYKIVDKPNIIVKAGPNAKWYLKRFSKDSLETEIAKQSWRDTTRCTLYFIEWDD